MENDNAIEQLVNELSRYFYSNLSGYFEDIVGPGSPIPNGLLRKEFIRDIKAVLLIKIMMINRQWFAFLALNYCDMLSSHEMYLKYVIVACIVEAQFTKRKIDELLNVLAVLINFNTQTFKHTAVNFYNLTSDVFMAVYNNYLRKSFIEHGGIKRMSEYIRHHEYLTWKWHWEDVASPNGPKMIFDLTQEELDDKIKKELANEPPIPKFFTLQATLSHPCGLLLARNVLSSTRYELPQLPSPGDLRAKLHFTITAKLKEEKRRAEFLQPKLHRFMDPPNDRADGDADKKMNSAQCENIIQAVIRCNKSQTPTRLTSDQRIPMAVAKIAESLKDKIRSLIEIVDELD